MKQLYLILKFSFNHPYLRHSVFWLPAVYTVIFDYDRLGALGAIRLKLLSVALERFRGQGDSGL